MKCLEDFESSIVIFVVDHNFKQKQSYSKGNVAVFHSRCLVFCSEFLGFASSVRHVCVISNSVVRAGC